MCPQAPTEEAASESSRHRVVRLERIAAGPRAALVRVTLVPGGTLDGAQLVVVDRGATTCCDTLPSPVPADGSQVTLGFAVTRTATPLALVVGGSAITLSGSDAHREIERELEDTRARLKVARSAYASIAAGRREALRAAARAEAAAHDATMRAAELARELAPTRRRSQRSGRIAMVAAGAVIPAAIVAAALGWPAGGATGDQGVAAVPAASASSGRPSAAASPAVDPLALRLQIPSRYLALYRDAATRYGLDWTRLAAIGAIESGHGQAQIAGVVTGTNADGASGPAQFLAGTWERFGLDGDGDGDRDPHDAADAIPAMASYLRASGAPQNWRAALRAYNHSDVYVEAVEKLASSLRRHAS
jgi:membrane-bound lytic murein transglycosylase B